MPVWRDEVEAAVDALVGHDLAIDLRFCVQILVVLRFDVFDDRLPAGDVTSATNTSQYNYVMWEGCDGCQCLPVAVVDGVAEAGSVDDAQTQLHSAFSQRHTSRLHL